MNSIKYRVGALYLALFNVYLVSRQGDIVMAFKMPKMASLASEKPRSTGKRSKVEDPATTGSAAAVPDTTPKYSDVPCLHSKLFVEKIYDGVNPNLLEASYARATWA